MDIGDDLEIRIKSLYSHNYQDKMIDKINEK